MRLSRVSSRVHVIFLRLPLLRGSADDGAAGLGLCPAPSDLSDAAGDVSICDAMLLSKGVASRSMLGGAASKTCWLSVRSEAAISLFIIDR